MQSYANFCVSQNIFTFFSALKHKNRTLKNVNIYNAQIDSYLCDSSAILFASARALDMWSQM